MRSESAPRDLILELAREMGFDLVGIAPLESPPDADHFEAWILSLIHI